MKTIKKLIKYFIIVFLIQSLCFPLLSSASTKEDLAKLKSSVKSEAAIVIEATTGKIIYSKNANTIKYPASTTKILTAIIAIEECSLDDMALVSEYAVTSIPSGYTNANIQVGETLSIKDLLYALMLASANEAAVVIAEHISGSNSAFADHMNEKATQIGCKDTHFVNANGMHNKSHYTTAYDMALITQYAMKNKIFREIVSTTSYTLPATKIYPYNSRTFTNTNSLIIVNKNNVSNNYYYPYAVGVKTGYTSPAGNCLVSAANNNGLEFITVILGAKAKDVRYIDTINLFNFAFNNYSFIKLKSKNNSVTNIEVENASDDTKKLNLLINSDIIVLSNIDNRNSNVEPKITLKDNLSAPIVKGEVVGSITYEFDGDTYKADLIASSDVERKVDFIYSLCIKILIISFILLFITGILIKRKLKVKNISKKRRHLYKSKGA